MRPYPHFRTFILALLAVLAAAVPMAMAEDSGVFNNPSDIGRAQRILIDIGYLESGSYSSGVLDVPTRKALSLYQSEHSLNASGRLDDDTYQMLLSHEVAFPGDEGKPQAAAAEPVAPAEPVEQTEPAAEAQVAEAPTAPEPTPATAEVKEAPQPATTPEPANEAREMPATASHLPLLVLMGLVLLGSGLVLLRLRKA